MYTAFLMLALLGGGILLIQLLLSLFGVGTDSIDHGHLAHMDSGLDLLSVRSVTAAATFFGFGGLAVLEAGGGAFLATGAGSVLGIGAAIGVTVMMRSFRRLESDGTVKIEGSIGLQGKVYLEVPGSEAGVGKVLVGVGDRTQEYRAITRGATLATGAPITVVDIVDANTVEVASPLHLHGADYS